MAALPELTAYCKRLLASAEVVRGADLSRGDAAIVLLQAVVQLAKHDSDVTNEFVESAWEALRAHGPAIHLTPEQRANVRLGWETTCRLAGETNEG